MEDKTRLNVLKEIWAKYGRVADKDMLWLIYKLEQTLDNKGK